MQEKDRETDITSVHGRKREWEVMNRGKDRRRKGRTVINGSMIKNGGIGMDRKVKNTREG